MDVVLTIDLRCFLGFPSSYSSSSKSWTERGFLCYLCDLGTHEHVSAKIIPSMRMNLPLFQAFSICLNCSYDVWWHREKEVNQVCRDPGVTARRGETALVLHSTNKDSHRPTFQWVPLSVPSKRYKANKNQTQKHLTSTQGIVYKDLFCRRY